MAFLGTIVGKLLALLVITVLVGAGVGVWAYSSDYGVQATVEKKQCTAPPYFITVKTKLAGLTQNSAVTDTQCSIIDKGNFVIYHIRSHRTIVYDREGGRCLYDSGAIQCGGAGGPGIPLQV